MIRELFRIGPLSISPFGVMMVVAFFAAYLQLRRNLVRLEIGDDEDASAILLAAALGGILGAKVYYAILYGDWRLLLERYGLVWYGGFVVATLAILWTLRRRRLPPWLAADAIAPALPLGYALGRIGCFLVGDDYGVPTSMPWGVKFPEGLPPTDVASLRREFGIDLPADLPPDQLVPVHPTQLYEAALALAIWGCAQRLLRRSTRPGTAALAVVALLALERFTIEFLRAKDDRLLGTFTVAQALSLGVLVVVAVLWTRRPQPTSGPSRQAPPSPRAASAAPRR
ncbi:MAG TPA: prolipoprotein diacylglyceryl transferase family protein [Thermoanaerobaculia bacterium]|nr:prolipoprotein diacylglyceryl transferase family protein [Thermoanaerobaculia bacterium]